MKKTVIVSLILFWTAAIAILSAGLVSYENSKRAAVAPEMQQGKIVSEAGAKISLLDAALVSRHATAADCWIIIDGNVYDVTSYIPRHPGGRNEIIRYCGKDGAAAFAAVGHSSKAQSLLASFYVGELSSASGSSSNVSSPALLPVVGDDDGDEDEDEHRD